MGGDYFVLWLGTKVITPIMTDTGNYFYSSWVNLYDTISALRLITYANYAAISGSFTKLTQDCVLDGITYAVRQATSTLTHTMLL